MTRILFASLVLLAGLAGCSTYEKLYQPAEFRPVTDVPKGPGLFTGESGVYTLCCGDGAPLGSDGPGADGNGYAGDDYDVVSNKPGEPVVIKRRRGDGE